MTKQKGPEPIHIACDKGDIEMAKLLLDSNASIEARNIHTDKTPLHYVSIYEILKLLLFNQIHRQQDLVQ